MTGEERLRQVRLAGGRLPEQRFHNVVEKPWRGGRLDECRQKADVMSGDDQTPCLPSGPPESPPSHRSKVIGAIEEDQVIRRRRRGSSDERPDVRSLVAPQPQVRRPEAEPLESGTKVLQHRRLARAVRPDNGGAKVQRLEPMEKGVPGRPLRLESHGAQPVHAERVVLGSYQVGAPFL